MKYLLRRIFTFISLLSLTIFIISFLPGCPKKSKASQEAVEQPEEFENGEEAIQGDDDIPTEVYDSSDEEAPENQATETTEDKNTSDEEAQTEEEDVVEEETQEE